ncbi:Dienelactone hydrolase [Rhodopseudomonas pseudopalustris]|uniref:Dienelactone hydrolase n=3 Tax=Rhodopseudomonas pseudopalustris TaxID=1513892 RepID=A0A1H8W0N1_9BRAD|nr:Dienelactone hydrolase [Rhodopseudomonas pseudopalustris]
MKWRLIMMALTMYGLTGALNAEQQPVHRDRLPSEIVRRAATYATDLTFPNHPETSADVDPPRMALLKPAGDGPFPAIVLVHQCSGLNPAVLAWVRRAISRDYAVLLLDSLTARGVTSLCHGPKAGVNLIRGTRDVLQAAQFLRKQSFVDGERVALVGFSWGGMIGLLASSRHYVGALESGPGFAAVVSFYPGCFRITPPNGQPFELVNSDIAQPLLVLMGEADTETPAADCVRNLDPIKAAGAPVEWHSYPYATHCWDCQHLDGFRKIDVRGNEVAFTYQQTVVDDSERRLFEFLDRRLTRP